MVHKCVLATTEIECIGHTLTPERVRRNDKKVAAVTSFPVPKTVKKVKNFLVIFISNLS